MNDKTVRKIRIKIYHFVDEKEKNKTVESSTSSQYSRFMC